MPLCTVAGVGGRAAGAGSGACMGSSGCYLGVAAPTAWRSGGDKAISKSFTAGVSPAGLPGMSHRDKAGGGSARLQLKVWRVVFSRSRQHSGEFVV